MAWDHIKDTVYERLAREGRREDFDKYRKTLWESNVRQRGGVCAPLVALYAFPPLDGSRPELMDTEHYSEIAAKSDRGKYPEPPESSRQAPSVAYVPPLPPPIVREETWEKLGERIDVNASPPPILEIVQWLYENAGKHPRQIAPDDVPCFGALTHLKHLQDKNAYSKFLETFVAKAIPDRKQLEYAARFTDDNRQQFNLIDNFIESL